MRITKLNKNLNYLMENHKNHEILRNYCDNYENHENQIVL